MENVFLMAEGDNSHHRSAHTFLVTFDTNHNKRLSEDAEFHLCAYTLYDEDIVLLHTMNGERITPEDDDKIFEEDDGIDCSCDNVVFGMITIDGMMIEALRLHDEGYFYYLLNLFDYSMEIDDAIGSGAIVIGDFI